MHFCKFHNETSCYHYLLLYQKRPLSYKLYLCHTNDHLCWSQSAMCRCPYCISEYIDGLLPPSYDFAPSEWFLLPTEPFSPLLNAALALLSVFSASRLVHAHHFQCVHQIMNLQRHGYTDNITVTALEQTLWVASKKHIKSSGSEFFRSK